VQAKVGEQLRTVEYLVQSRVVNVLAKERTERSGIRTREPVEQPCKINQES